MDSRSSGPLHDTRTGAWVGVYGEWRRLHRRRRRLRGSAPATCVCAAGTDAPPRRVRCSPVHRLCGRDHAGRRPKLAHHPGGPSWHRRACVRMCMGGEQERAGPARMCMHAARAQRRRPASPAPLQVAEFGIKGVDTIVTGGWGQTQAGVAAQLGVLAAGCLFRHRPRHLLNTAPAAAHAAGGFESKGTASTDHDVVGGGGVRPPEGEGLPPGAPCTCSATHAPATQPDPLRAGRPTPCRPSLAAPGATWARRAIRKQNGGARVPAQTPLATRGRRACMPAASRHLPAHPPDLAPSCAAASLAATSPPPPMALRTACLW